MAAGRSELKGTVKEADRAAVVMAVVEKRLKQRDAAERLPPFDSGDRARGKAVENATWLARANPLAQGRRADPRLGRGDISKLAQKTAF